MTTIARVCRDIDKAVRAAGLGNDDYADIRMDLEELARENDELRQQLARCEDRFP